MQALWLTGNPLRCFRVADEQIIVDTQGVLLGGTNAGEQPTATPVELAAACAQVDLLVLVAGATPLDGSWLGALPAHIPKLGFLSDNSGIEARIQLTMAGVDGYVVSL